jgi:hypothetical protein
MYDGWDTRSEPKLNQIHSKLDTSNKINSAKSTSSNKTIKELSIGIVDTTPYLTE